MIEIGSSEAPVILGVSSWETPWHLWARKAGLIPHEDRPDEVMKAGTRLQDYVIDMEWPECGWVGSAMSRQRTDRNLYRPWQRSTPDADITDPYGTTAEVWEVKCLVSQPPPVPRVADVVQCLHHLLVFDHADHCRLIYFGGLRRERFIIPRHQGAFDRVLRAEESFLEMVEKQTPPPVKAEDCDSLWRGWPLVADRVVTLPDEAKVWDLDLVEAAKALALHEKIHDEARAKIKAAMGDALVGVLPDGSARFTWRPRKDGVRVLNRRGKDQEGSRQC